MSTKIQINSLAALERLIGGDSGFEIQVRNSVVQEFAKKHLKALVTKEVMDRAVKATSTEVQHMFFDLVKDKWGSQVPVFKPEVLSELRTDLQNIARTELYAVIHEVVKTNSTLSLVEAKLKEVTERIIGELETQVLSNKLDKMVESRIKQKLGLS